jgi:hypothetical protein
MTCMQNSCQPEYFRVVHPLEDAAEQKCISEGLGQIAMTPERSLVSQDPARLSDPDDRDVALSRA